jgi:hypothetical protein
MTTSTHAPDLHATVTDAPDDAAACPACPHPLALHDPIGARFCRATAAAALSRGCVCRAG